MSDREQTELGVLHELEPVVEQNLNRHLEAAAVWYPDDLVPWSQGENFEPLGGTAYDPDLSRLSPDAQLAMVLNWLTEENLPSYHHIIRDKFGRDGAWGQWVGRWTAEEGRHGMAIHNYLVTTRGVDPHELEDARMAHMSRGYDRGEKGVLETLAYVSFQELATRVSHRNTGIACGDPIAEKLLAKIANDENLHMVFYRNLGKAALDVAPDAMMKAILSEVVSFQMPGSDLPNFGRLSVRIANAGIYTPTQHLREVLMPVLKYWKIFERTDFSAEGEEARAKLALYLSKLAVTSERFEDRQAQRRAGAKST